ncbi:hypothetical protein [Streptosporangium sp. NPDC001681]|uniref:hypothetical protein n=1 Tax=Streptosporangium sp. NPDC001681 TaxID=3154395 RepID=UPI003323D242
MDGLKDKTITLTVKTEYQDELSRDALREANKRADGGIYSTAGRQYMADGGIRAAAGPVLMAGGGIRAVGSSPAARIASSPQLISGRSGPDVIFAEAGAEAFIPLSPAKRTRGLQVLGETARLMGQAVVPMAGAVSNTSSSVSNMVSSSNTTNWSRTSRPVQSSHVSSSSATYNTASGGPSSPGGSAGQAGGDVHVHGMTVRSEADINQFAAQVAMRISGRG